MNTKFHFILLAALFLSMGSIGSLRAQEGIVFNYFTVAPEGADVLLEWEIQDESSILRFELVRKFENEGTFELIETLDVNGSGKYKYLDDDIFKNTSRTIHYELHVITDLEKLKFPKSLLHAPTSIQRTWGSIKAMFR